MKRAALLFFAAIALTACVTTSYLGKSYAPTTDVDLFFRRADVPRAYEVMGHIDATPQGFSSLEKAQEKIMEQARAKGADAVLLEGIESVIVDPKTTTTVDTNTKPDGGKTQTVTSTHSATTFKTLKATFIKYR